MKKKIRNLMIVVCSLAAVLCTGILPAANVQAAQIQEKELEEYIMDGIAKAHIPGMSISIVNEEKELYCASFGVSNGTSSDYVLGSVSKSFTAAAIMRMVEDSELRLEDTVSNYLPQYKEIAEVTIGELLHQTSGIAWDETMDDLKVTDCKGSFRYSNCNYNVLGEIIEVVSGMSYEEYVSDNILDPLEMTSTYSLRENNSDSNELVTGYQNYFGFPFVSPMEYDEDENWSQPAAGYMISDVKDMAKYLQMYLNNGDKVLGKESVEHMLKDTVDASTDSTIAEDMFAKNTRYGMGWVEQEAYGEKIYYHTGKVESYSAIMAILPKQKLGITMLFNSMDFLVGDKILSDFAKGVISMQMGQEPVKLNANTYFVNHAIIDGVLLAFLLLAWIPIFTMSVWMRRRKKKVFWIGIVFDVLLHVALPTVVLLVMPMMFKWFIIRRFVPDIFYSIVVIVASFYLGGVIKLIAGTYLLLTRKKRKEEGTEAEESRKEQMITEAVVSEEKAEKERNSQTEENVKTEETADSGKAKETVEETANEKAEINQKETENPETAEKNIDRN